MLVIAIVNRIARMAGTLRRCFGEYLRDTRAVSTVEYALIVIAVVAIVGGAATMLSGTFDDLFTTLETNLEAEVDVVEALNPEDG